MATRVVGRSRVMECDRPRIPPPLPGENSNKYGRKSKQNRPTSASRSRWRALSEAVPVPFGLHAGGVAEVVVKDVGDGVIEAVVGVGEVAGGWAGGEADG